MPHFEKIVGKYASVYVSLCFFKSWQGNLIRDDVGLLVCCLFFIPFPAVWIFAFFSYKSNPVPKVVVIRGVQHVVDTGCSVEVLARGNRCPLSVLPLVFPLLPEVESGASPAVRMNTGPRPKSPLQERAWSLTEVGCKCQSLSWGSFET